MADGIPLAASLVPSRACALRIAYRHEHILLNGKPATSPTTCCTMTIREWNATLTGTIPIQAWKRWRSTARSNNWAINLIR